MSFISIIVPTFNESENVGLLIRSITEVMGQRQYEVLFVDDSTDQTPRVIQSLMNEYPHVRLFHRPTNEGLASAVVDGIYQTKGDFIVVMDADLQHPPATIPLLIESLLAGNDIAIGSRYVDNGSDGGFDPFRRAVSWTARVIGRLSLRELRHIEDTTSGFFAFRRTVVESAELDPIGWKILIEILAKGQYKQVDEVGFTFHKRNAGQSKLDYREPINYLRHIAKILIVRGAGKPIMFAGVGALGVLVNMFSIHVFELFRFGDVACSVLASLVAMLCNFTLNDRVTWKSEMQTDTGRKLGQVTAYFAISTTGLAITACLFYMGHTVVGLGIDSAQLIAIGITSIFSYKMNKAYTWGKFADRKGLAFNGKQRKEDPTDSRKAAAHGA